MSGTDSIGVGFVEFVIVIKLYTYLTYSVHDPEFIKVDDSRDNVVGLRDQRVTVSP